MGAPLPSHLRPRGSPREWSLAAGQPRAAPGYLHNLCPRGATPPPPLPERARNYRGPIGGVPRPRGGLRANPARASLGSKTEAGAAGD